MQRKIGLVVSAIIVVAAIGGVFGSGMLSHAPQTTTTTTPNVCLHCYSLSLVNTTFLSNSTARLFLNATAHPLTVYSWELYNSTGLVSYGNVSISIQHNEVGAVSVYPISAPGAYTVEVTTTDQTVWAYTVHRL